MPLKLSNRQARCLLVQASGLSKTPIGAVDAVQLIRDLGFVQLDTIRAVVRAHHHILWSRNNNYREAMLWDALEKGHVFEHFTHDASILPIELYGIWKRQFDRMRQRFVTGKRWVRHDGLHNHVMERITLEGPLSTHAFDTKIEGKKEMWARPPHKRALDYLWYCGDLATSHRKNFTKYYDLTERVVSDEYRACSRSDEERLFWLCDDALRRLSFATKAELQDFWGAASAADIARWLNKTQHQLIEVEGADGKWTQAIASTDTQEQLDSLSKPTSRLRILSPFDPLVRDRKRLLRVFGFDYRIEIFVPAAKRKWGYYVYPILEGDRFVGRIDLKADRKTQILNVINFWPEPGVKWTIKREEKLQAELMRLARFAGTPEINRAG